MWIILRILIAVLILFAIQFYFSKKFKFISLALFPSLSKRNLKLILSAFLFLLNLYPALLIINSLYAVITSQSVSFPQHPLADYLVIYPFWVIFLVLVQSILIFLLIDILKLPLLPLYKKYKERLVLPQAVLFMVIIVFFLFYVPGRIIYDFNSVDIRKIFFSKDDLPQDLNGFKLVLISDIQADRYTNEARLNKFINAVNSTDPDLVLIAGDVITSTPDYIRTAAFHIGNIKSEYGVYSCVGDHDNWAYRRDTRRSIREISAALGYRNVEMVDNSVRVINVGEARLGITFITNTYVEKINKSLLAELADSNHNDFKIFLTHQPQNFLIRTAEEYNYDIFLAGHTHGGQITFLFPFIPLTPTLIETRYVKGDFYFNNMLAVISGGLGMSLAPVRYNSTPEIVVIELKAR